MKTTHPHAWARLLTVSALLALSACSNTERSRDLNNPEVSASTTALQVCSNCHGVKGVSTSPNFPNLAGQSQAYLEKQLTDFRSHGRSDPEGFEYMWGLSSHLTDGQIKALATYFSQLPPTRGNVDNYGTPEMLSAGRAIFEKGIEAEGVPACSACHGVYAQGSDQFPRLAGQHADYLVKQINVFKLTEQRPTGVAMKAVTHNISSENIMSVAAYLETLPPAPK